MLWYDYFLNPLYDFAENFTVFQAHQVSPRTARNWSEYHPTSCNTLRSGLPFLPFHDIALTLQLQNFSPRKSRLTSNGAEPWVRALSSLEANIALPADSCACQVWASCRLQRSGASLRAAAPLWTVCWTRIGPFQRSSLVQGDVAGALLQYAVIWCVLQVEHRRAIHAVKTLVRGLARVCDSPSRCPRPKAEAQ
jgi:hypothetical protein